MISLLLRTINYDAKVKSRIEQCLKVVLSSHVAIQRPENSPIEGIFRILAVKG